MTDSGESDAEDTAEAVSLDANSGGEGGEEGDVSPPIEGYDQLTVDEIRGLVSEYSDGVEGFDDKVLEQRSELLEQLLEYESQNKERRTADEAISRAKSDVDAEIQKRAEDDESDHPSMERGSFVGNDGIERILVRNPEKKSRRLAGKSFEPGEVKDLVLNGRIKAAIRHGELQTVRSFSVVEDDE